MNVRGFVLGLVWLITVVEPGGAAVLRVSEIYVNSPPASTSGAFPDYIEVHYTGFTPSKPFDVVVMNAVVGRESSILAVIPVVPSASQDTIVIHRDAWSSSLGVGGQFQQHTAALRLADSFASARRILLMDGRTGWTAGTSLGGANAWGANLHAVEMLELSINGGSVSASKPGFGSVEHITAAALTAGEALFRHVDAGSYLDAFSRGAPAATGYLPDGQRLNPTQFNVMQQQEEAPPPPSGAPAPSSAAALAVAITLLAARRSRA